MVEYAYEKFEKFSLICPLIPGPFQMAFSQTLQLYLEDCDGSWCNMQGVAFYIEVFILNCV
jgi:hypothetical protein